MTSKIEWLKSAYGKPGYSINPVKGLCPVGCSYCYARAMYKRFKWNPEIRWDSGVWMPRIPAGSRVFVGSTIDLFHQETLFCLPLIMRNVILRPDVTFIFLTKCPQNLPHDWPDNCWVGVSAVDDVMLTKAWPRMTSVKAKVKFVSFEPLQGMGMIPSDLSWTLQTMGISWIIIGQQTPVKPSTIPKIEWIAEIETACKNAGIPYFEKDNLASLLQRPLRQEWPKESKY